MELTSIQDTRYKNTVTVTGYTKNNITKQDLIKWADDNAGYIRQDSPIMFEFYGEKAGRDYVALDQFCSWLEEEDAEIVIKESYISQTEAFFNYMA
tara:strand:- start:282 stop:569 length:288 start_codon:yes stop_codon:yes gene_type:complete